MEYAVGRALWAPQLDQGGKDIYHQTREVQTGDICLHMSDPGAVAGISRVAGPPRVDFDPRREGGLNLEEIGVHEGLWYLVRLKGYRLLDPPLAWSEIFTEGLRERLLSILSAARSSGEYLFFTENLHPIGYVTPAPPALVDVLDEVYRKVSGKTLREIVGKDGIMAPSAKWDTFIEWSRRFYEWEHFNEQERDYKLKIAANLKAAKDALLEGSADWGGKLRKAFAYPNNLTTWQVHDIFLGLIDSSPEGLREALRQLWRPEADATPQERARGFADRLWEIGSQQGLLKEHSYTFGSGQAILASFLLMADDGTRYPIFRATPYKNAYRLTEHPSDKSNDKSWERYGHALDFVDEFIERAEARGLRIQDRLDAQSLIWCVTKTTLDDKWPENWPKEDKDALAAYRKDGVPPPPPPPPPEDPWMPEKVAELAEELLWEPVHLQKIIDGLRDKRQVIFQGPPGTGKTYVAKRIAEWCKQHGGDYRIVQFHPSYAYEDFVEGFRPTLTESGQAGFTLTDGPLRRCAEQAEANPNATFILVIDEINRGNLAKVLGELYFLLEYRDEQVALQYSNERFSLPKNLWFIGTMNTTDRSIALVDAALRRRFYFFNFFPDQPPIEGLLRRWIKDNNTEAEWVADLVELANRKLEDRHLGIGPSYFMKNTPSLHEERVRFIWEQAVIPYIEEQCFGDEAKLKEFAFDGLKRELDGALPEQDVGDSVPEGTAGEGEQTDGGASDGNA